MVGLHSALHSLGKIAFEGWDKEDLRQIQDEVRYDSYLDALNWKVVGAFDKILVERHGAKWEDAAKIFTTLIPGPHIPKIYARALWSDDRRAHLLRRGRICAAVEILAAAQRKRTNEIRLSLGQQLDVSVSAWLRLADEEARALFERAEKRPSQEVVDEIFQRDKYELPIVNGETIFLSCEELEKLEAPIRKQQRPQYLEFFACQKRIDHIVSWFREEAHAGSFRCAVLQNTGRMMEIPKNLWATEHCHQILATGQFDGDDVFAGKDCVQIYQSVEMKAPGRQSSKKPAHKRDPCKIAITAVYGNALPSSIDKGIADQIIDYISKNNLGAQPSQRTIRRALKELKGD